MGFSERLKELRAEKKLTQRELAVMLNLTPNSICEWEKNRSEPSINLLFKLSQIFEVPIGYLVGQENDFGHVTMHAPAPALSDDEASLLKLYRSMTNAQKTRFISYGEGLTGVEVPKFGAKNNL